MIRFILLIPILVISCFILFMASITNADTEMVRIFWVYDHQDIPEYAIDTITVEIDGIQKCSDDSPIIDTEGRWRYSCPWDTFEVGVHQARLIFTDISGFNTYTQIEEITIPEPPTPIPERIEPIITGHEVI